MKEIIIRNNDINQRIDKFLKKEVFFNEEITRGEIIRQIKNGHVLVNDKKVKPSYILREDDKIEINFEKKSKKLIPNKKIKFEIIYKDENIIAINKPAGISVHPVKLDENNTLANGLIYQFPEIKNVGDPSTSSGQVNPRPGIVHRLDKDTSGVMVIARNQKAFLELKNKFKNREVGKKYLTLVYGQLENKSGVIEKPIARSSSHKKQVIAGKKTRTTIRPAITEYKVIKEFRDYSLVEVSPKTGRMHQIRVHMTSIEHPVVGDKLYKGRKNKKADERPACNALRSNAGRQLLHAKNIEFNLFGEDYAFEASMPDDFELFLTNNV
jgi:23S rRNA pseudouridine1911/1915/1917 synthase